MCDTKAFQFYADTLVSVVRLFVTFLHVSEDQVIASCNVSSVLCRLPKRVCVRIFRSVRAVQGCVLTIYNKTWHLQILNHFFINFINIKKCDVRKLRPK